MGIQLVGEDMCIILGILLLSSFDWLEEELVVGGYIAVTYRRIVQKDTCCVSC